MTLSVFLGVVLAAAQPTGVQLPNPAVFGKETTEPVKLLVDKTPGDVEPYVIWSDVRCGRYFAASAFYRQPATAAAVKAAIIRAYGSESLLPSGKIDPTFGLWRVERERFAIQMAVEDDSIRVTYIHFMPTGEVMKNILESTGAKRTDIQGVFGSGECVNFDDVQAK
jgi:hypothetical protein